MHTNGGEHGVDPVRQALIVGLGRTGLSCARYLADQGYAVRVVDSRAAPPMEAALRASLPDVSLTRGGFDPELANDVDLLAVSPGVSLDEAVVRRARERGIDVVGDVELFARVVTAPVIAVTGSNGKSTVTTLVGELCRHSGRETLVGGNIGVPVLDLARDPAPQLYVLELSSFQLETTFSLRPQAAAVLNISADHMDRYADLDEYARAKGRIFRGAQTVVANRDDPRVIAMAQALPGLVSFGLDRPPRECDYGIEHDGEELLLVRGATPFANARRLGLSGRHNVANVLAAAALVEAAGVSLATVNEVAERFTGLPHRCETLGLWDGVRWINDSKGTNVGATLAAVEGLRSPVVLIAGGVGKGADFSALRPALTRHGRAVVLIGRDAALIEEALGAGVNTVRAASLSQAVKLAAGLARPGDTVMLSPACASFDMFADYRERGEAFRRAVTEYHA